MRDRRLIAAMVVGLSMVAALGITSGRASAGAEAGLINFDDVDAPCVFSDTKALRDEYAAQGVHFRGNAPLNGGGIVNECGNWGVSGYTPPNFLGLNVNGQYGDGGSATPPQYLFFDNPVGGIRIKAGARDGGTLRMVAYDTSQHVVGTKTITMTPALQTVTIVAPGIKRVSVDVQGVGDFVIDDLQWR